MRYQPKIIAVLVVMMMTGYCCEGRLGAGGKSSRRTTSSSTPTINCGDEPPQLPGRCDVDCILQKAAHAGIDDIISAIPGVGSLITPFIDAFWPDGEGAAVDDLNNAVKYLQQQMATVVNTAEQKTLSTLVNNTYTNLVKGSVYLKQQMQALDHSNPQDQETLMMDLQNLIAPPTGPCTEALTTLQGTNFNAISNLVLLRTIQNLGTACIAVHRAQTFHFTNITGMTPTSLQQQDFETALDDAVANWTSVAEQATSHALTYRRSMINVRNIGHDIGACNDGWYSVNEGFIEDTACRAAGGPPSAGYSPQWAQFVSNYNNQKEGYIPDNQVGMIGFQQQCHHAFTSSQMQPIGDAYLKGIEYSYTDNFLAASRTIVPLWKYQTTSNIQNKVKPTNQLQTAMSLVDNQQAMLVGQFQQDSWYISQMESWLSDTMQWSTGDRIAEIQVAVYQPPSGYFDDRKTITGMKAVVQQGGNDYYISLGNCEVAYNLPGSTVHTWYPQSDERITGIGYFDLYKNDSSMGFAFTSAIVDGNGKKVSDGNGWNPFGYTGDYIQAPPITQMNTQTEFMPHIIAFWGFSNQVNDNSLQVNFIGGRYPIWLFENQA